MENRKVIPDSLVEKTKQFLGPIGIAFFIGVKKDYGCVNAVWNESGLPHPVHFREGMQIRNFMRGQKECEGWDDHDFDHYWVELIERCIGEE